MDDVVPIVLTNNTSACVWVGMYVSVCIRELACSLFSSLYDGALDKTLFYVRKKVVTLW